MTNKNTFLNIQYVMNSALATEQGKELLSRYKDDFPDLHKHLEAQLKAHTEAMKQINPDNKPINPFSKYKK